MSGVYGTSVRFNTNSVGFCDIIIESSPSEHCFELAYEVIYNFIIKNKHLLDHISPFRASLVFNNHRSFPPETARKLWLEVENHPLYSLNKNQIEEIYWNNGISYFKGLGPLFIWGISISPSEGPSSMKSFINSLEKELNNAFRDKSKSKILTIKRFNS